MSINNNPFNGSWICTAIEPKKYAKLPDGQDDYSQPLVFGTCNYRTSDIRKAMQHQLSHGSMQEITGN